MCSLITPFYKCLQIFFIINQRFIDEHGQPCFQERTAALDVLSADIGGTDNGIDFADHVFRLIHHIGNE